MTKKIRICAGGFLVKSNQFLFGLRSKDSKIYPSVWDIFGGHLENSESPEKTLKREFKEELGITPTQFELFGIFKEPDGEKYGMAHYHIYFVTKWHGLQPGNCSKEHSEIRWFTRKELETMDLASKEYLGMIDTWQIQKKPLSLQLIKKSSEFCFIFDSRRRLYPTAYIDEVRLRLIKGC